MAVIRVFLCNKSEDTVYVKISGYQQYYYGNKISASGNLKIKLLINKTEILTLNFPKISLMKNNSTDFLAVVNFIRQKNNKCICTN